MRNKVVEIKNVLLFNGALTEVKDGPEALPKIVMVSGEPGTGKTTTLQSSACDHNAVYVRMVAVVTIASLLESLCFELGVDGGRRNSERLKWIVDTLKHDPRPIFIDEADFLTRDSRMLETIRDIHDLAKVPVVLIGMDGMERKLAHHMQFSGRISQRVDFKRCDLEDAGLLTRELCEVEVAPDLVKRMHSKTRGSIRGIIVALAQFERFARGHRWKTLNAEQWGDRAMFSGDRVVA